MPLNIYRRHIQTCPHKVEGIDCTTCTCPVWVDGPHPLTGQRIRRSIGSRDWQRAKRLLDRWESDLHAGITQPAKTPQLAELVKLYLTDCAARRLAPATIRSYSHTLTQFAKLITTPVDMIDVTAITNWRNAQSLAPGRKNTHSSSHTIRKQIIEVRTFCKYLVTHKFLTVNPASEVQMLRPDSIPTEPFTHDEVSKLLAACSHIKSRDSSRNTRTTLRARALTLLLLYSGLRISDAIKLERTRIDEQGRILIRMMKTGGNMYVKLPAIALTTLASLPVESPYFLWSGQGNLNTATGSARRTIDTLGRIAGINAHPHRFRDTFSVELLLTGADLRTVQLLLGHTSIKTTEKHYAPWVQGFQKQLDEATSRLRFA